MFRIYHDLGKNVQCFGNPPYLLTCFACVYLNFFGSKTQT